MFSKITMNRQAAHQQLTMVRVVDTPPTSYIVIKPEGGRTTRYPNYNVDCSRSRWNSTFSSSKKCHYNSSSSISCESDKVATPRKDSKGDTKKKKKKSVSFHTLEIIEFPYALGNDSCSDNGPALSSSWNVQARTTLDVSYFERYRPPRQPSKRLSLSPQTRKDILLRNGYTEEDINQFCSSSSATDKEGNDEEEDPLPVPTTTALTEESYTPIKSSYSAELDNRLLKKRRRQRRRRPWPSRASGSLPDTSNVHTLSKEEEEHRRYPGSRSNNMELLSYIEQELSPQQDDDIDDDDELILQAKLEEVDLALNGGSIPSFKNDKITKQHMSLIPSRSRIDIRFDVGRRVGMSPPRIYHRRKSFEKLLI